MIARFDTVAYQRRLKRVHRSWVTFGVCAILGVIFYLSRTHLLASSAAWSPFTTSTAAKVLELQRPWPRKIWQTWSDPVSGMDDTIRNWVDTWMDRNPGYRYELLTDDAARAYVIDKYATRPDIVELFLSMEEPVLRADYIRYLALLADGGVYGDVDTECTKSVDDWMPSQYRNQTGLLVGIEYDARNQSIRGDFDLKVQLCQWTFASRAGNSVLQYVIERVTKALQDYSVGNPTIKVDSERGGDILYLTGPRIFTKAIIEAIGIQTGRAIVDEDIMNLTEPKLIGDVLIMPINAFGSGQSHSGSEPLGNAKQLIGHHFRGHQTWKPAHKKEGELWPGQEHHRVSSHSN